MTQTRSPITTSFDQGEWEQDDIDADMQQQRILSARRSQLATSQHVSLMTYRDSGVMVPTILWVAPYFQRLVGFVGENSSTALRIKAHCTVQVAPCDAQGNLLGNPTIATARVMDHVETPVVNEALRHKYGWQFRFSKIKAGIERVLRLKADRPTGVEIVLEEISERNWHTDFSIELS